MDNNKPKPESVGEAYLGHLVANGIDYLFGNAGTDFPAIIEGLARAQTQDLPAPKPITVPHENVAVSMAYGYYLATGRVQAVMLHVNVGTANGICAMMNASRDNIPILFTAGRTPITEHGLKGSRNVFIHWAQEMFDQAGMVREMVKWDYELRLPEQVGEVVNRAVTIAKSAPQGPVYLSLPREILAMPPAENQNPPARMVPASPPGPSPAALGDAMAMIENANNPVIIASSYGRAPADIEQLGRLSETWALPVVNFRARRLALTTDHPMHMGFDNPALVEAADLIIALDADVPWIPTLHAVSESAKIIQIGTDPLFSNYPMRTFPCDLAITADSAVAVSALLDALGAPEGAAQKSVNARLTRIAGIKTALAENRAQQQVDLETAGTLTQAVLVHILNEMKSDNDIVLTETFVPLGLMDFKNHGTYFGVSSAGGLGWGLGAALGIKLGAPDARVISFVGDGAYMFGNPTPSHFVSRAYGLPTLTIIVNNAMWGSVRKATLSLYPDGAAAAANDAPFTHLEPSPDYEKIVEASGGYGEKVTSPAEFKTALERAFKAIDEGRPALLNAIVDYHDNQALADSKI